jgi:Tc5 transposase DNA-binding domain
MQKKKLPITGEILKVKAHEVFNLLPQYADTIEPKWSNGWLDKFKKRHNIKEYVCHGEGATADISNPDNIRIMEEDQLASTYALSDILNMDETGLYWKLSPNRSLATEAASGGKKSKDRITLALTTNATGTDQIKVWVIGNLGNRRIRGVS